MPAKPRSSLPLRESSHRLEALYWHDGVFRSASVACIGRKEPSARLEVEVYASESAKSRHPIAIAFDGVLTFHATATLAALLDHASAGNISFCHVEESAGAVSLSMHLVDGYVRIAAKRVRLSRRPPELQ